MHKIVDSLFMLIYFNLSTPWAYFSKTIFQFVKDKVHCALISLSCPFPLPTGTEQNFKIRVLHNKSSPKQLLASSEFNKTFNLRNKLNDILGSCLMKQASAEALDRNSVLIICGEQGRRMLSIIWDKIARCGIETVEPQQLLVSIMAQNWFLVMSVPQNSLHMSMLIP